MRVIIQFFGIVIFGTILYQAYDNVTGGRNRCEAQCKALGANEFVWVPETKSGAPRGRIGMTEVDARCTCYTDEDIRKNKEKWNSMKEAMKRYKKVHGDD